MLKGTVRIIGGQWRSQHVHFLPHPNIKPTPDRVRETLFNWLSPTIAGSYCLDLFAGSGALGFESLSRDAAWVGFVEHSYRTAHQLQQSINQFQINDRAYVYYQSYESTTQGQLARETGVQNLIDLVFLDPPFRKGMLEASLCWLAKQPFLSLDACCYIEYESSLVFSDEVLKIWSPIKRKRAGQLEYGLWKKI